MHTRTLSLALVLTLAAAFLGAPAVADSDDADRIVSFHGRQIDLKPYVEGFPYSSFRPFYDAGRLFYNHIGETTQLQELDLRAGVDLAQGRTISDIDFSTRNVWTTRFSKADQKLYWIGDERNDEIINLYRLDPASGHIEKLSDVPYIFGWRWNAAQDRVAYVARMGDKEDRLGELRVVDLRSGETTTILQDNEDYRFTWGSPSWQPEGRGVVVPVLRHADRKQANLVYVDFDTRQWKLITDPEVGRVWPGADSEWLSNDEFVYYSNEDGFENAYRYDLRRGTSTQVTHFERDIASAQMVHVGGKQQLFAVTSSPIETRLSLVDPRTGDLLVSQGVDVNVELLDVDENRVLASSNSAVVKFRIDEIRVEPEGFHFETLVDIPKQLEKQIMHASVERVTFPTFDIDPATGEKRMLHGYLYKPENPLPPDQQLVMIQSFYGGGNYYSTRNQILAEAGIYVFSPSPRGSSGFGREFSALNDKDLGGNEIVDVIYAAKWVSDKLDIPPARVGVFGGSHGGYATMRCLTFPGEINGVKADFDWGFGLSHAGFSDIIHFYEHCNIPDWVILEAGDPATEAAKLRDRSPLYHAREGRGKLLLTHGTNDSRVPIEGSRAMADSLRKYGKDVTLVEFEGQGHGIKGLANTVRYYKVWFDFLESIAAGDDRASR
jgi:dipeptidyl aminopeptidase/acylaminoacyl peptidase